MVNLRESLDQGMSRCEFQEWEAEQLNEHRAMHVPVMEQG